jgi:hypothetical protein
MYSISMPFTDSLLNWIAAKTKTKTKTHLKNQTKNPNLSTLNGRQAEREGWGCFDYQNEGGHG